MTGKYFQISLVNHFFFHVYYNSTLFYHLYISIVRTQNLPTIIYIQHIIQDIIQYIIHSTTCQICDKPLQS